MKNWYIVQSHSSFENKVAQLIKEEADKAKISDKIEEIVVPTHELEQLFPLFCQIFLPYQPPL
mgnify:CR=1 FL=1